jgi:organic hydroperoxide reductase OsmC/OhrA
MRDLTIRLQHRPGALAAMGEALGNAGVSIEGGGGFVVNGEAIVHFLVEDAARARAALAAAGIEVLADREVLAQRLAQDRPGQLGLLARRMADAGVDIEVVYSDHANRLILVVDDAAAGAEVSREWSRAMEAAAGRGREHRYATTITWTGNAGKGTSGYREYRRDHEIAAPGKPVIPASSDPHFRGDGARWNPEDLLVASLSACHQLWYLHLCADAGVVVTSYVDRAEGVMRERADGGGAFERVVLRPEVTVTAGSDRELALSLHDRAHALCFIARSVNFPVEHVPVCHVAPD